MTGIQHVKKSAQVSVDEGITSQRFMGYRKVVTSSLDVTQELVVPGADDCSSQIQ